MKSPRFHLWTLLAAAAIAGLAIWLLDLLVVTVADGQTDVHLRFLILDARTRQPIPAALVSVDSVAYETSPIRSTAVLDGMAPMDLKTHFSRHTTALLGRRLSFYVSYPGDLRVAATGYAPFRAALSDYTSSPQFQRGGARPPPIVIALEKLGPDR